MLSRLYLSSSHLLRHLSSSMHPTNSHLTLTLFPSSRLAGTHTASVKLLTRTLCMLGPRLGPLGILGPLLGMLGPRLGTLGMLGPLLGMLGPTLSMQCTLGHLLCMLGPSLGMLDTLGFTLGQAAHGGRLRS